jgi:VWFA-related protein
VSGPGVARLGWALLFTGAIAHAQQTPTFRSGTDSVTVNVSVKHGNVAIPRLTAHDFRLTDNGVVQAIDAVALEAVPVDVTVFHDTSQSQGGRIDDLKDDARRIAALLRDGDRFRLLTFGVGQDVIDVFGWQPAGAARELNLDRVAIAAISSVNDGILAGLMHRPAVGRRHLVVALTDGQDWGSIVSGQQVRDVAARSESVLHLVMMTRAGRNTTGFIWSPHGMDRDGKNHLREAAELTGGQVHDRMIGSPDPVEAFDRILEDFRTSYVLRYTPTGVEREGWHEIEVSVPSAPRATIRARRGYYGSSK